MKYNERGYSFDPYESPRFDRYDYYYFSPDEHPDNALLARQIQAQSYINMRIARPESLITLANGAQVLSPEASNPSGRPFNTASNSRAEYALGIKKDTDDLSPITGKLVSWKKLYAPLDALPAYQFCKDSLWPEGEQYLQDVEADPLLSLVEPEGLSKTINADSGVVKEFIRAEIQRVIGQREVWFMGLVESTAYESFVHNWGQSAVRQIGASKLMNSPHNYDDVALVPTIIDIDNFFDNMVCDILAPGNKFVHRQLVNFVYMSDGISDDALGSDLANFRDWARDILNDSGSDT